MSLEERLVGCYVLHAHNACCSESNDLVDKLHGVAVGQELTNAHVVHHGCVVRVIDGRLDLMLANFAAHLACKLVVYGVSRTCCYDASLDRLAYERHVAYDVEELVTCTFVLPHQRLVLNVSELCGVHVRHLEEVGKLVQTLLCCLLLVDHDCVVEIAALNEVSLEQRLYVAHKDEGACLCNLCRERVHLVERCKLAVDKFRVE